MNFEAADSSTILLHVNPRMGDTPVVVLNAR